MGEGSVERNSEPSSPPRSRPWRSSFPGPLPKTGIRRFLNDERLTTLMAASVVGVCGGFAAIAFRVIVDGSFRLFAWFVTLPAAAHVAAVLALPAVGGLGVGLLARDTWQRPGDHGMVGIKAAFITSGGVLRTRKALHRAFACAVTTGTGGSAGCEGAVARVAGAVGSWLAQRFGLHRSRLQVLVACGVSASLAGLFHTPFAAVVFATEQVLGGYAIRSLAPLVVSSATATVVARAVLGSKPAFGTPPFALQGPMDLIAHLGVGLSCGVAAAGLMHLLDRGQSLRTRIPEALRPALGGLGVGAIAIAVPGVTGIGYPVIDGLFQSDLAVWAIVALLVGKSAATLLTLGSRGAGGVFAPSLLLGGSLGWLIGAAVNEAFPGAFAPPLAFAAAGMAAMIAGVTHAPFTGVVLLIECTRSYHAVLPGVVAAVAASVLSSTIRSESAVALGKHGLREPAEPHASGFGTAPIDALIDPSKDTVPADLPARELLRRLPAEKREVLIVADGDDVLGVVVVPFALARSEPTDADEDVTTLIVQTGSLASTDSVARSLVKFKRHDAPAMPVIGAGGELAGLVWRADLMDLCAHELLREYLLLGAASLPSMSPPERRTLRHEVAALPVPGPLVGQTLRDVDIGKKHGIVCVGIRRATDAGTFTAVHLSPKLTLRADDVLIVTGNATDLERLAQLWDPSSRSGPGSP